MLNSVLLFTKIGSTIFFCLQLKSIIEFAQTAFFLVDDAENDLQRPSPIKLCQHMIPQVNIISAVCLRLRTSVATGKSGN